MATLFEDTTPEAEAVLLDLLRKAEPWRKLQMVEQLNTQMKTLMWAGLRQRQPQADEHELHRRMADLLLGPQLAEQAYGRIFLPKERTFDHLQFANRTAVNFPDEPTRTIYLASPEDTILAKLEWYRLGGEVSERQWRDILGILQVQRERLDFDYLRRLALEMDISDLLDRAIAA